MKKQDLFSKYKGDSTEFVETGTHRGEGIRAALKAGFQTVYSFEITGHIMVAGNRFKTDDRVNIYPKSSKGDTFRNVIGNLSGRAVIWLDAYPANMHPLGSREDPLQDELNSLSMMSRYPHTVLISRGESVDEEGVLGKLRRKHPDYTVEYEDVEDVNQKVMCVFQENYQ